jgi:ATP-dependent RNA helicase DeaD
MICKAGGVSKRDVGSIRIDDTETRFEISGDKAADFATRISEPGSTERGIVIAPAGEAGARPWQAKPKFRHSGKSGQKPFRKPHRKGEPGGYGRAGKHPAGEHRSGKPGGRKPKRPA